jgi:hypothetical protein
MMDNFLYTHIQRLEHDFVYVVMKRQLCVESRLSALCAAILTSNGLIDRFSLWLPGWVISHKRGKDREVFTTSGTYPWSFVTHIFHNGQPSRGGNSKTFEVMTPT